MDEMNQYKHLSPKEFDAKLGKLLKAQGAERMASVAAAKKAQKKKSAGKK